MENLARVLEEPQEEPVEKKEPDLKVVEKPGTKIEESLNLLVLKLREYKEIIDDILGGEKGETEKLAKKVEAYVKDASNSKYISGSSFEHVINNLTMQLCPRAKHFMPGSTMKGSESDKVTIIESFGAMNDYFDLLKNKKFKDEEMNGDRVSSKEDFKYSVVQYIEKYKKVLEEK